MQNLSTCLIMSLIGMMSFIYVIYDIVKKHNLKNKYEIISSEFALYPNYNDVYGKHCSIHGRLSNQEKNKIINNPQWNEIKIIRRVKLYGNKEDLINYFRSQLDFDMLTMGFEFDRWLVSNPKNDNQSNVKDLVLCYVKIRND